MKYTVYSILCLFFVSCSMFRQDGELTGLRKPDKKTIHIDSKSLPYELKELIGGFVYIPMQTIDVSYDISLDKAAVRKISIDPYFISAFEVSNSQYRKFCKEAGPEFLPDTLVWRAPLAYNEPYVNYYFRHTSYDDYPVVGVTFDQAMAYCEWLNKKVLSILEKYPKLKDRVHTGEFRLPTKYEWECAARAENEFNLFPFGNIVLYADKKGNILYHENFKGISDAKGNIMSGLPPMDGTKITSPVYSYTSNDYGIYGMGGNVSEWTCTPFPLTSENLDISSENFAQDAEAFFYKGGSWKEGQYYMMINTDRHQKRDYRSCSLGFRVIMTYFEKQTENGVY